ncbi:MAG: hypothetical protein A3F18_02890 [Legionellales bacterium RIFCSPHIGHO2_12_FULL_37_14]|nr:MAG: hypothetical protein A3F18_02890 [Legionellales bacterium RIFCSPHIGHO2_12_FULL_37_14]
MQTLYQILGLLAAGAIIWFLYYRIKNDKTAFSRENLSKSFSTMGILGLILIVFVAILVYVARM